MYILHSGQTGVERGAHRAARMLGCKLAGFANASGRDEFGPLPSDVAVALIRSEQTGPRVALEGNIAIASAVIVLVPDRRSYAQCTGMAAVGRAARSRGVPLEIADPSAEPERLHAWLMTIPETSGSRRCLVTGPRATRWAEGERLAWRLVTAIMTTGVPGGELEIPARPYVLL